MSFHILLINWLNNSLIDLGKPIQISDIVTISTSRNTYILSDDISKYREILLLFTQANHDEIIQLRIPTILFISSLTKTWRGAQFDNRGISALYASTTSITIWGSGSGSVIVYGIK